MKQGADVTIAGSIVDAKHIALHTSQSIKLPLIRSRLPVEGDR
jgi:hypothetical protein